ncbi:hypothetical protein M0R45_008691 [Rubus argutus]|uniref:Uncharacterized protein n=1 Tax=Rubus argutus TaxID=59490 RepID=A0AAW1Y225_RUBAR
MRIRFCIFSSSISFSNSSFLLMSSAINCSSDWMTGGFMFQDPLVDLLHGQSNLLTEQNFCSYVGVGCNADEGFQRLIAHGCIFCSSGALLCDGPASGKDKAAQQPG